MGRFLEKEKKWKVKIGLGWAKMNLGPLEKNRNA
jgi:hypothetical protein